MRPVRRHFMAVGLSFVLAALAPSSSSADMFGSSAVLNGANQAITITDTAVGGGEFQSGQTYWAEYQTSLSSSSTGAGSTTYLSYCVDLAHGIPGAYTHTALTMTNKFSSGVDNYTTNLNSFGQAAYIANTAATGNNMQIAGAQIAIWAAVYGNGRYTYSNGILSSGNISFTGNTGAESAAYSILSGLGSKSASGYWVDFTTVAGTHAQYQLIAAQSIAPEPSTLAIGGLGALGFLAYGWKRRKPARPS